MCFAMRVDRDGSQTLDANDQLSPECVESGRNLEFVLVRRPGYAEPGGSWIEAKCLLTDCYEDVCGQRLSASTGLEAADGHGPAALALVRVEGVEARGQGLGVAARGEQELILEGPDERPPGLAGESIFTLSQDTRDLHHCIDRPCGGVRLDAPERRTHDIEGRGEGVGVSA